jgi:hypothetical protein
LKVVIGFSVVHSDTGLMVKTAMVGAREGTREETREASKQVWHMDQLINRLKEHKVGNVESVFLS